MLYFFFNQADFFLLCFVFACLGDVQILEHSHDLQVLLIGRVLGGISTALLFSAFESWVVSEHRALKLGSEGEAILESMWGIASTLNGIAAVLAGFIARVAFQWGGEIAPFQVSLVITIGCMLFIAVKWTENTGGDGSGNHDSSLWHDFKEIIANKKIVGVGSMQALFEGAMFTFVFMWVSVFLRLADSASEERPPIELLFSVLMLALSCGGLTFDLLSTTSLFEKHMSSVGALLFLAAAGAMGSVSFLLHESLENTLMFSGHGMTLTKASFIMFCFCIFEACVGLFDPWIATMRSIYVPERVSATVMTLSRVPLNVFVGIGVHLTSNYDLYQVFAVCSMMHFVCAIVCLLVGGQAPPASTQDKKKK